MSLDINAIATDTPRWRMFVQEANPGAAPIGSIWFTPSTGAIAVSTDGATWSVANV